MGRNRRRFRQPWTGELILFAGAKYIGTLGAEFGCKNGVILRQISQKDYIMHDIVDTAVAAGSFKTLVAAVTAAGLVDTLKGDGPFTVFAPSDDAFAKLPSGTVDDLVKPENKAKLTKILTLHVIPGKVMAADVTGKKMSPTSVSGETLDVDGSNGVMVSGATVTSADIECTNGVIHIIDSVIMPKG